MSADIVPFKRKSPKLQPEENDLLAPTKEQIAGFITTLEYLIDLNASDSAIIEYDADGEIHFSVTSLQDFSDAEDIISATNLNLVATGNLNWTDIPESTAVVQTLFKRVDLDNIPDPREKL